MLQVCAGDGDGCLAMSTLPACSDGIISSPCCPLPCPQGGPPTAASHPSPAQQRSHLPTGCRLPFASQSPADGGPVAICNYSALSSVPAYLPSPNSSDSDTSCLPRGAPALRPPLPRLAYSALRADSSICTLLLRQPSLPLPIPVPILAAAPSAATMASLTGVTHTPFDTCLPYEAATHGRVVASLHVCFNRVSTGRLAARWGPVSCGLLTDQFHLASHS